MTPKIYSAEIDGETHIVFRTGTWHDDEMCYRDIFTQQGFKESSLTDLTELEFHKKGDGMWVANKEADFLVDLLSYAEEYPKWIPQYRVKLTSLIAQLSEAPASEEVEVKCDCQNEISEVTTTTAKVEIELTEYDKVNVETAMKTIPLPAPLAEIIAKLYNAIQPIPPMEEPKGYETFVRANEQGFIARPKWQKNIANNLWYSDDGDVEVPWSDLINPCLIGGAE